MNDSDIVTNTTGSSPQWDHNTLISIAVAGVFCFASVLLTAYLVLRHMKHWVEPVAQTHIVRILLMVPVYALSSWLSLLMAQHTVYFNLVRDCYEAYVLYQFFSLLVYYFDVTMGGDIDDGGSASHDTATADYLVRFPARYHPYPCCCLPAIRPGAHYLLTTKRCILQYVLIKPLIALLAMILQLAGGLYDDGSTRLDRAYVWLTLLANISVALSLYGLVIFYDTISSVVEKYARDNDEPRPLYKLLVIKTLLFFIFWQGLAIDALYYFNLMPGFFLVASHDILNNALVCAEMWLVALINLWVYPYASYRVIGDSGDDGDGSLSNNTLDQCCVNCWDKVLRQRDIMDDTREVFLL